MLRCWTLPLAPIRFNPPFNFFDRLTLLPLGISLSAIFYNLCQVGDNAAINDTLTALIRTVETLRQDMRSQAAAANATNARLNATIAGLNATVAQHEISVARHENTIARHENTIARLEMRVAMLEATASPTTPGPTTTPTTAAPIPATVDTPSSSPAVSLVVHSGDFIIHVPGMVHGR